MYVRCKFVHKYLHVTLSNLVFVGSDSNGTETFDEFLLAKYYNTSESSWRFVVSKIVEGQVALPGKITQGCIKEVSSPM